MNITFDADALALLESEGVKETLIITNAYQFGLDLAAIKEFNKQSGGKAVTVSALHLSLALLSIFGSSGSFMHQTTGVVHD